MRCVAPVCNGVHCVQCRNVDVVEHARVWLGVQVVGRPVVTSYHTGFVADHSFVVVCLVKRVTLHWTLVTKLQKLQVWQKLTYLY